VVWGHGLLSDRASEDGLGLFDWSVVAGVRLVRYDARGHGRSDAPTDPDELQWSSLGQDMVAVADAVDAERFVAGGASMGCATALHAAVATPDRVEALVLVIPPTAWETRAAQAQMYAAGVSFFRDQPEQGVEMMAAGLETVAPLGEVISAGFPEATAIMQAQMRRLDPARLPDVLEGASRSDLPDPGAISALDCPALILAWDGDPGHPRSTAERVASLLANSELHVAASVDDVRTWPEAVAAFLAH
jgi:pimeloyl-ACP methyl ester carboxylesterase